MKSKTFTTVSHSEHETIVLGRQLAHYLTQGMVVALSGPLGSGKTTLVKGLVAGLFKSRSVRVKSPSFALINQYEGQYSVYHVDCYRLNTVDEVADIGIDDFLFADGITVIEWADKIVKMLPNNCVHIRMSHAGERSRRIAIRCRNSTFMQDVRRKVHG